MTPSSCPQEPSLVAARRLLDRCERGGVAFVHGQGHRWLQTRFLPSLLRVDRSRARADRRRRAQGWYFLGDVHDFNKAPRAAIEAYRKSLRAVPAHAAAWREIGGMLEKLGRPTEAEAALRRAIQLDPEDENARLDLDGLSQWSLFRKGDPILASSEAQAKGRWSAALAALVGLRSVAACQARARVLAAEGDAEGAMQEWERIADTRGPVDMGSADRFYTMDLLDREARFWDAVLRISPRAADGQWCLKEDDFQVGKFTVGRLRAWIRGYARNRRDALISRRSAR